jgi:hypothetical protein
MILFVVSDLTTILRQMEENPKGVRFAELRKICEYYFGDPRVNIQNNKGKAKPYQVRQVLHAIQMLKVNDDL